jgi:transposase
MQDNGVGEVFVGVDVSKAWIDVCRCGSRHVERVANTPDALAAWVAEAQPTLVAMEPTGGYERALCSALAEAGVRYVKLHPNAVLAFRKARGLRAKTDRIDAMLIAHYLADAVGRADLPAMFRPDPRLTVLSVRRR